MSGGGTVAVLATDPRYAVRGATVPVYLCGVAFGACIAVVSFGIVDDQQRTATKSVFAVGEICGVGGAEVARAEGELAAAAILAETRGAPVPDARSRAAMRERRASDAMLRAFAPLPGLVELARPDTIVCRCEDVRLLAAQQAAQLHGDSHRAIKMGCRAGMGPCQARICGPSLQALATGDGARAMDRPIVQVPLKPVRAATIEQAPGRGATT